MIGKNTKAMQTIKTIGDVYGVSYDDKTLKNISEILISHRMIFFNKDMFDFSIPGCGSLEEIMPYVYRNFIKKEPISTKCVNKLVLQILNDENTADVLYDTLEAIKKFQSDKIVTKKYKGPIGKFYFDILHKLYFTEANPVHTEIYTELGINSNVYSYRKEEATMLFGIYFWQRCLSFLGNWKELADKIRREEGREDLNEF